MYRDYPVGNMLEAVNHLLHLFCNKATRQLGYLFHHVFTVVATIATSAPRATLATCATFATRRLPIA